VLLPLVILFVVVPIAELAIIIQVGGAIGVWPTIAILIVDSLLGAALMRSQGRAVWRRFNVAVQSARPPATEVIDGGLVIFGGALLLAPGFLTDILGLLLMLPPTRAVIRSLLVRRFAMRMVASVASRGGVRPGPGPGRRPAGGPHDGDVEGTAHELDDRGLRP
jgi:UPF0716 protein FxsA